MSDKEKNKLNYQRSKGVSKAWGRERELVSQGRGTRPWTVKEQKELLKTGRVKGYQGHHMKSVAKHPEYAADPKNIQFLDARKGNNEHLKAHRGDYRNESDGRYNINTEKIRAMKDGKPRAMNSYELKEKAIEKRGYTKYAANKEGTTVTKRTTASKADQRAHVKSTPKKSVKAESPRVKAEAGKKTGPEAQARYGKAANGAKPGSKATARKSSYAAKTNSSSGGQKASGSYGKQSSTSSGGRSTASGGRSSASGGRSSSSGSRGKGR